MLEVDVFWEIKWKSVHEFIMEFNKFLFEIFLFLFDSHTLFLLKWINILFELKDDVAAFLEFLFGLVYDYDINFMFIQINLMLFE